MVVRVTEPGRSAFQLRKGEEGISVFVLESVDPPLTEAEILSCFRPGSVTVARTEADITVKGLQVIPIPGADPLTQQLREAHAEIRRGPRMTRTEFKQALKELD